MISSELQQLSAAFAETMESMVDRQLDAFDVDDDVPHVPSTDPLSNPQSRRKPVHVS